MNTTNFTVTRAYVAHANRAAFVAWHHTWRVWRRHLLWIGIGAFFGGFVTLAAGSLIALLLAGSDAVALWRGIVRSNRHQKLGSVVQLKFGPGSFSYETWDASRTIPMTSIRKVVVSNGCAVIVALPDVFWPIPLEAFPETLAKQWNGIRRSS